jgi:hypothetical protein
MTPAFAARLSPSQARALAVALAVALLLAVAAIVLVPVLLLHRHYDEAIESLTDRLMRYRRVAAQAPEITTALAGVREPHGRRFFLRNTQPNLASAELSEMVRGAVESHGGRITTSQNVAPKDDDAFKQIGASVQFFATTTNLQRILASLEAQQPHVVINTVTVRPVNAFRGFKPAPGQDPELVVQLDAIAWAFPEPARATGAPAAPKPAPGR